MKFYLAHIFRSFGPWLIIPILGREVVTVIRQGIMAGSKRTERKKQGPMIPFKGCPQ
jgi:hypothetical protein